MSDLDRYLTEEVVEKAARAIYESERMSTPWRDAPGEDQRWFAGQSRAALSAVLPGIIQRAKAEAWEEGAHTAWERSTSAVNGARYCWRHDGEPANPYRADRIEHDARCPHPKCPGGGLCCCLSERGGQP